MAMNIGDILEITCKLNFNSVSAVRNVYHVKNRAESALTDEVVVAAIADYMSLMYYEIRSLLSNNMYPETIQVVNLTGNRIMGEVAWPVPFVGGTSTANSYALGVCALIRLLTGVRGRQGRKFIGILTETHIDDAALLATATIALLADFGRYLLEPIELSPGYLDFGVYDRVLQAINLIVDIVISAVPAYQRRRKQGRGI